MKKKVIVFGSTGSIGRQTLEVIDWHQEKVEVVGLSARSNFRALSQQAKRFKPRWVLIEEENKLGRLKNLLDNSKVEIHAGKENYKMLINKYKVDLIVMAMSGVSGLLPTFHAIATKNKVALATKEVLVAAGHLFTSAIRKKQIIPIDSEHSAIFQCLQGEKRKNINKIILTASGGPHFNLPLKRLKTVTVEETLKHPTWNMGKKITVDSATLMNKGLEILEAKWLFDLNIEQIEVVIHPQSIIHSLVEFNDKSVKAQLSFPDMRLPIQYALFYPYRVNNSLSSLNLTEIKNLTFKKPPKNKFPCLSYAIEAGKIGGSMPVVLNAANEVAVNLFLQKKIGYLKIPELIRETMDKHKVLPSPSLKEILNVDKWAREYVIRKTGV